jgi:hypothetical protein
MAQDVWEATVMPKELERKAVLKEDPFETETRGLLTKYIQSIFDTPKTFGGDSKLWSQLARRGVNVGTTEVMEMRMDMLEQWKNRPDVQTQRAEEQRLSEQSVRYGMRQEQLYEGEMSDWMKRTSGQREYLARPGVATSATGSKKAMELAKGMPKRPKRSTYRPSTAYQEYKTTEAVNIASRIMQRYRW